MVPLLLVALQWAGCAAAGDPGEAAEEESMNGMGRFESVEMGTFMDNECSPDFDHGERGIKLDMPEQIVLPAAGVELDEDQGIPLCMAVQVDALTLRRFDHIFRMVSVVITGEDGEQLYAGPLWQDRTLRPRTFKPMSEDELREISITKYYNPNLLDFVPIPRIRARYHIYAVLEDMKSNTRTFEVVPEDTQ